MKITKYTRKQVSRKGNRQENKGNRKSGSKSSGTDDVNQQRKRRQAVQFHGRYVEHSWDVKVFKTLKTFI